MARKRGSRFGRASDAQEQYEQIEERRQGKSKKQIDSIEKSRQREKNLHKRNRRPADLGEEFDMGEDAPGKP